ncbi:PIN-like domain-containing protein [Lachnospiraceae bacterium 48-33]
MITIEKFQEIRSSEHLIVLDTNVLLELYRQPANISLDVISALKKIQNNIHVPRQVYDEYLKNYHKTCGDEKKKYKKVTEELSDSLKKLENDIAKKIGEYRKHNYTDISKLQNDLNEKIKDIQNIITNFEKSHHEEIQLNIDFLENDKVKEFIDLLHNQGNIGEKIPFSQKLLLLQEGQIRYNNLIPPGFRDSAKIGEAKYGDLFVWKDIIAIAKEKNTNIIFVCNDTKEDWWEKNKDTPIDLRHELNEEFKETNPSLSIHFLTLDKFFSYLSEELKLGKSKSALQLSALDDIKSILDDYEDEIYQSIGEYLITINVNEELDEELETGDENIYWSIADISVDKENKNIIYYVNLDISVLADLIHQGEDDSPYAVGKIALALIGHIKVSMEEYSKISEIKTLDVEKSDILHIEPEVWSIVKHMENKNTCKDIIAASKNVTKIQENVEQFNNTVDMNSLRQTLQQYATLYEGLAQSIKPIQTNGAFAELSKQTAATQKALSAAIMPLQANSTFSELAKQASLYQSAFSAIKPLQANGAFSELAKQASLYQSALSAIKPLQANGTFSEMTKQFSANKKMNKSTDDQE